MRRGQLTWYQRRGALMLHAIGVVGIVGGVVLLADGAVGGYVVIAVSVVCLLTTIGLQIAGELGRLPGMPLDPGGGGRSRPKRGA